MNNDILGGWCKVGSKVVSDFFVNDSNCIRTVTKVIVYADSPTERNKGCNGYVWTDGGVDPKTGYRGRPLDRVSFTEFIRKPDPSILD